ncbi:MAG TPA: hypothetical protein VKI44_11305 [Acetobacteraceae bacterium]|nr:hypothetical protein [Acetobacteraceae bacterium]
MPPLRLNSFNTIGAAVSRPPLVLLHMEDATEHETVLITRSPGVNIASAAAKCGAAEPAMTLADASNILRREQMIAMTASRFPLGNTGGRCSPQWALP